MIQPDEAPRLLRPFVSAARAWCDFWFKPGDPTTLGFIRICTGAVFLAVLLASGPLLESFYSPEGWVDAEASDVLRKEMPWMPPENGWQEHDPDWFVTMDADGDGAVTLKEWKQAKGVEQEFRIIDANNDGRITPDEANRYGRYVNIRPEVWQQHQAARQAWEHWGVDPAKTIDLGQPFFSHFYHLTTPLQRNVAHVLALLIAVLFTLGVGTRVTSVLAWLTALCYVHRVPAALFGMDTMMAIVLLYLMIGPSGAALSIDRLWTNRRRRKLGLPVLPPEPNALATVATRLMQVHFCIMYFAAGASKLQGPAWWNGTAIWQTLTNYEFTPRPEWYTEALRGLTHNRWVWEVFHTGGAWATVGLELSLPFLIWRRGWRWFLICCSVLMHVFIALTMGLTAFSLFMVCILFAFVPPETVRALVERIKRIGARRPPAAVERRERVAEAAGVT